MSIITKVPAILGKNLSGSAKVIVRQPTYSHLNHTLPNLQKIELGGFLKDVAKNGDGVILKLKKGVLGTFNMFMSKGGKTIKANPVPLSASAGCSVDPVKFMKNYDRFLSGELKLGKTAPEKAFRGVLEETYKAGLRTLGIG